MQAKMDNINRLIDKKFGPSKLRPILMYIWFESKHAFKSLITTHSNLGLALD